MTKVICLLFSLSVIFFSQAHASWTLTNPERRAFLEYYAPIIFKRANGDDGEIGRDWITNYDFDRDFRFNDNKREWKDVGALISASASGSANARFQSWRLRPTLYTSLIEYMDGGQKHLVLIYQIYYGFQENASKTRDIHDFERVEIHIKNVSTARQPNRGESAAYAVITQHKRSVKRGLGSPDYNFFTTSTGKHLMLWQAEHTGKLTGPHGNELRFVEDSAGTVLNEMSRNINAEVEIIGSSADKNVHYIFVPEFSAGAVSQFNAQPLNYQTAASLASGYDNGNDIKWSRVKRIKYELQDIADIISTHWSGGPFTRHWQTGESEDVFVEQPFQDPENRTIPYGRQIFYTEKADVENGPTEPGIMGKSWFWGTHELREVCDVTVTNFCLSSAREFDEKSFASTVADTRGRTRAQANGDATSAGRYWRQHDFFVHSGIIDNRSGFENGFYLTAGWATPARGGFDGRWFRLFPDRTNDEPTTPLRVTTNFPSNPCQELVRVSASASGGKVPYTFTWRQLGQVVSTQSGVATSATFVSLYSDFQLSVTDSDGGSFSQNYRLTRNCGPNEVPF